MVAFAEFITNYAVWFYIIGAVGLLYGLKMLFDARRQSRNTIFSLEQEQAGEQGYRAVAVMLVFALIIGAVWAVNLFLVPNVPNPQAGFSRTPTSIPRIIILPTFTPIPSPTIELPTPTRTLPPTRPPTTDTPLVPTAAPIIVKPTSTRAPAVPAPNLIDPPDRENFIGENKANSAISFRWEWKCDGCFNATTDSFQVVISYTDRASGTTKTLAGQTKDNVLRLVDIIRGSGNDLYHSATNDQYFWYLVVVRNGVELSPHSQTNSFFWR